MEFITWGVYNYKHQWRELQLLADLSLWGSSSYCITDPLGENDDKSLDEISRGIQLNAIQTLMGLFSSKFNYILNVLFFS